MAKAEKAPKKGSKRKVDEDEVKTKAKKKAKARDDDDAEEKPSKGKRIDLMAMYSETMDVISKRQNFESSTLDVAPPTSTGFLAIDQILGGGIRACMLTAAGNEQCAKTTLALAVMASCISENIPIIGFMDYEGSTKNSKPYVASILKTMGLKLDINQVFGKRNSEGKWAVAPRVRYRSETILERFYDWMSEILRELPDKRYVEGDWWLVFDDKNKRQVAQARDFVDAKMTKKYGNGLWVKAPDDKMQGIIFLDSYTAMNPEIKDEESISNQLSVKASAFSKQLERIKGRMANKMVTVYGLNHLRSNPMAMFGPKEDEKGGNALKQFSDVRLRQVSRSLSAAPFSPKAGKKTFDEWEQSVEFPGRRDVYRYVNIKAIKNKLWTPQRDTFIRIWVEDGSGQARGLCPVFDTIQFLKETGQLTGTRAGFRLVIDGLGKAKNKMTWEELKLWILGDKEAKIKMSKRAGFQPMDLRKYCFKQMKSGKAEDLYVEYKNSKGSKEDKDGGDE